MVFSVAVGYIKHLAMTRVAWELLCFQPLQTRGSDAGWRQPSPACGCVGQVCRVRAVCVPCVPAYGDGVSEIQGDQLQGETGSLPCRAVCHTQGFHPLQSQHFIRAPPAAQRARAQAGGGQQALAEHCRSHLTRARGAAPLGGSSSSRSRRRLLSRWDCAGVRRPMGHRGARQSQRHWPWVLGSLLPVDARDVGGSCPSYLRLLVLGGASV